MGTLKQIKMQNGLTKSKTRIIAHLKADGCIFRAGRKKTNYWIKYEVRDKKQLQEFADDIKNVYGLDVKWSTNPSGFTGKLIPLVYVRSKMIFEDLSKYGGFVSEKWSVPPEILNSTNQMKREFLRAFFDDEGTITNNEIRLYSINEQGIVQIKTLLEEFHIFSCIRKGYGKKRNVFGLVIKDIKSIKNFHEKIGFNINKKAKNYCL